MAKTDSTEKTGMMDKIASINAVDGFDPTPFAVDYTDLNSGETRKRLPVMIQMAWFRLKYPEGKIAVHTEPGNGCFVATARVYPSYKDPADCFLAEATASRGECRDKPSVSPREWAQTAAVGIALRNAGFGLQFGMAGEESPDMPSEKLIPLSADTGTEAKESISNASSTSAEASPEPERELTIEERYEIATQVPCPITKYSGKTLGEVLMMDPKAMNWIATKFTGDQRIKEAAQVICEYALQQASA